jgi:hypothetical protein
MGPPSIQSKQQLRHKLRRVRLKQENTRISRVWQSQGKLDQDDPVCLWLHKYRQARV